MTTKKPSDAFRPPFFWFPTPSNPLCRHASDAFRHASDHPALCRAASWVPAMRHPWRLLPLATAWARLVDANPTSTIAPAEPPRPCFTCDR